MSNSLLSVKVKITGRVQGVGYRAWTLREANSLQLSGTVENMPDGSVVALFCGPAESVSLMIERCKRGPAFARVDELVEIESGEFSGELSGFQIFR